MNTKASILPTRHRARDLSLSACAVLIAGLVCSSIPVHAAATEPKAPGQVSVTPAAKTRRAPARGARSKEAPPTTIVVTGSYLGQKVAADGTLPVTASAVGVLTAKDISRLGAANLSQALRRGIAGSR